MSQQPTSRQETASGETPVQNASTSGSEMGEPGTDGEFASAAVPTSPRADAGTPPDAAPTPTAAVGTAGRRDRAGGRFGTPPGPPGSAAGGGPGFGTPPGPPGGAAGGGPGFGTPPGPPGGPAGGGPGFGSAAGPGGFRQAPSSGTGGGQAGGVADSERARGALNRLRAEVGKVVVGQDPAVTGLVIALLCRGHVLLEGVPGRRQDAHGAGAVGGAGAGHQAAAVHART